MELNSIYSDIGSLTKAYSATCAAIQATQQATSNLTRATLANNTALRAAVPLLHGQAEGHNATSKAIGAVSLAAKDGLTMTNALTAAADAGKTSYISFSDALNVANGSVKVLQTGMKVLEATSSAAALASGLGFAAAAVSLVGLIISLGDGKTAAERQRGKIEELTSAYNGLVGELDKTKAEMEAIEEQMAAISSKQFLTGADAQELMTLGKTKQELERIVYLLERKARLAQGDVEKGTVDALNAMAEGYYRTAGGAMLYSKNTVTLMEAMPSLLEAHAFYSDSLVGLSEDTELYAGQIDNANKELATIEELIMETAIQLAELSEDLVEGSDDWNTYNEEIQNHIIAGYDLLQVQDGVLDILADSEPILYSLSEAYGALTTTQQDAISGISQGFGLLTSSLGDLTREIVENEELSWESTKGFQDNVLDKTTEFADLYSQLIQKGVSESYLDAIGATGPEAIPLLQDMLNGNIAEVLLYQKEWEAAFGGISDSYLNAFKLEDGQRELIKSYILDETGVFGTMKQAIESAGFPEIGGDVANGFTLGIQENAESAVNAAKAMGAAVAAGTRNEMLTHSPSEVFWEIGLDVVLGFEQGITENAALAITAMEAVMQNAKQVAMDKVAEFPAIGGQMMAGLQRGIESGAAGVVNSMKKAVADAISAAKAAADIHSPSRVMQQQVGGNMMQGWIDGVKEHVPALGTAFQHAAEVSVQAASIADSPRFAASLSDNHNTARQEIELDYARLSRSIYDAVRNGKQEVKFTLDFAGATDSSIVRALLPELEKEIWRRGVSLVHR